MKIGVGISINKGTTNSELLPNGAFNFDIAGWTSTGSHAPTWVSGKMRIVSSSTGYTYQSIPTAIGVTYRISGEFQRVAGSNYVAVRKADDFAASVNVITAVEDSSALTTLFSGAIDFVATATTTFFVCQINGAQTVDFDNLSIR